MYRCNEAVILELLASRGKPEAPPSLEKQQGIYGISVVLDDRCRGVPRCSVECGGGIMPVIHRHGRPELLQCGDTGPEQRFAAPKHQRSVVDGKLADINDKGHNVAWPVQKILGWQGD